MRREVGRVSVALALSISASLIAGCAARTPDRRSTWINARIKALYTQLHRMGCCHSIECRKDGELVGGLYGVRIGGVFFGESMFSRATDASKVALVHLVARLNREVRAVLQIDEVRQRLQEEGVSIVAGSSEQFGEMIRSHGAKVLRLIKAHQIRVE